MLIPRNFDKLIANFVNRKTEKSETPKIDISNKIEKAGTWIKDNPEAIASIIGVLYSGRHIIRSLIVSARTRAENQRKERTIYDPRTGIHYILTRQLSSYDYQYISDRRKEGYDMYDILSSLKAI